MLLFLGSQAAAFAVVIIQNLGTLILVDYLKIFWNRLKHEAPKGRVRESVVLQGISSTWECKQLRVGNHDDSCPSLNHNMSFLLCCGSINYDEGICGWISNRSSSLCVFNVLHALHYMYLLYT